jgi:class 3 adenylate cyclase/tetratricopeptide (TPR) repeat protein
MADEGMPEHQVRKVVTVLFTDVIGSTALGEDLDPETTRAVMGRYFSATRRVIERHGGAVEKFVGDAVMAVFGIPTLHEDDALRAVRAAAEVQTALEALNRDLEADLGVLIRVRTGINTGEVVAGDPASGATFVTGDAVNVAARLEQAAAPGEILMGAQTHRLVRNAVSAEPVGAVEAKGKSSPILAWRLIDPGRASRRDPGPQPAFVGRRRELRRLEQAFEDAVDDSRCELFTLLGQAGVGKSRLLAEFLDRVGNTARVIRGRCLPYGEGITYWPLAEALRAEAGIAEADSRETARQRLEALAGSETDPLVAARLAAAIGLSSEIAPRDEIFWATRKLLEHLARDRPVVAVFEDIHWAEPTFLDAIEHIADMSRGARILLVCPARPELLERRPGWGGGKLNATTMLLEALPPDDAKELIAAIPGGSALPLNAIARITDAAEGNPLFVHEMIGMLADEGILRPGGDGWTVVEGQLEAITVPPNIQALLAARLDQLIPEERTVAGRASVVGRVFEQAAVTELAPQQLRPGVATALVALVRKELIVPERAQLTAGDAFKFRHILIRDAAYESLPKAERADLHEQFADWLERAAGDRLGEYEEILGYHLEEAHGYRHALGFRDERTAGLGQRAGAWLARAGEHARGREDARAARNLLSRALRLLAHDDKRYWQAMLGLGDAILWGDIPGGLEVLDRVVDACVGTLPMVAAEAAIVRLWAKTASSDIPADNVRREVAAWLRTVRHLPANERVRSEAWRLVGESAQDAGDVERAEEAYRRSVRLAGRSGNRKSEIDGLLSLVGLGSRSQMPVPEVRALAEETMRLSAITAAQRAWGLVQLAFLAANEERFDEARSLLDECRATRESLGVSSDVGVTGGIVEMLAGRPAAAEAEFASIITSERELGIRSDDPFVRARMAQAVAFQGRHSEALALADARFPFRS